MRISNVVISCLSSVAVALAACNAPPAVGEGSGDLTGASGDRQTPKGTDKSDSGTTPPGTTSDSGTTTPPATGSGVCAGKVDADSCFTCCEESTPAIVAAVDAEDAIDEKWKTCACASSRCAAACKTDYCSANADADDDPVAGSACETCLDDNTDDCDAQFDPEYEALEKTPGYVAWEKCDADSLCDSLPE
jgi:hypothetical protein